MSATGDDRAAGGERPDRAVTTNHIPPDGKYESHGEDVSGVNILVSQIKAQAQAGPAKPTK